MAAVAQAVTTSTQELGDSRVRVDVQVEPKAVEQELKRREEELRRKEDEDDSPS